MKHILDEFKRHVEEEARRQFREQYSMTNGSDEEYDRVFGDVYNDVDMFLGDLTTELLNMLDVALEDEAFEIDSE